MSEKTKYRIAIAVLAAIIAVLLPSRIGQNNTASAAARIYRERAEDCERRLEAIGERCRAVDESLGTAEQSIHGIVEQLYAIADEVREIEALVYDTGSSGSRSSVRNSNIQLAESLKEINNGAE